MEKFIGTKDNYIDFSKIEYGNAEYRDDLKNTKFEYVDFNSSSFQSCNLTNVIFKHCDFTRCDFTDVRQWNCIYENCKFDNTKFFNATMGVDVNYSDCRFIKSKLNGKYFDFGHNSEFKRCDFVKCDIRSAWILSVKFYECTFSSKLANVRFSGKLEAQISISQGIFKFPATFIKCDMSKSIFEELEIMDGTILIETILPDQYNERFDINNIYYPKKQTTANERFEASGGEVDV